MINLDNNHITSVFEKKKIEFLRTTKNKLGIPFLFENQLKDETKKVTRIFDRNGNPKEPLYTSFNKSLNIIPIQEDDLLLKLFYDDSGIGISIIRLLNIDKYSNEAEIEVLLRKPSNTTEIIINRDAAKISNTAFEKIKTVFNTLVKE